MGEESAGLRILTWVDEVIGDLAVAAIHVTTPGCDLCLTVDAVTRACLIDNPGPRRFVAPTARVLGSRHREQIRTEIPLYTRHRRTGD